MLRSGLILTLFSLFAFSIHVSGQLHATDPVHSKITKDKEKVFGSIDTRFPELRDGNGTLGNSVNHSACGLDYVTTTVMTTTRYSPPGTGFPVNMTVAGIPGGATVIASYAWWGGSYSSADPDIVVNGNTIVGTSIGTGIDKCWGLGGTENFRANITSQVTGNGTYSISCDAGASGTDGVTIMVIYSQPGQNFIGTITIEDGCIANNNGQGTSSEDLALTCPPSCNPTDVRGFLCVSDMQDNVSPPSHSCSFNGASGSFPNLFWNYDQLSTTMTAGQTISPITCSPDGGGDCYNIVMTGIYYRINCLQFTTDTNAATCGNCDGSASATTCELTPITYNWAPAPGAGQGTGSPSQMCAGNYTLTAVAGDGCVTQTLPFVINSGSGSGNPTVQPAGPFCVSDAPVSLSATPSGGSWNGPGITDTTNGTFDPATAGVGTHTITYTTSGGSCAGSATINIVVNSQSAVSINPAGPFCSDNAPAFLAATGAGGTWSGNGITNAATGIFDPSVAGAGTHTITYITPGSCGDTATTSIQVIQASDATITPAGPFCVLDNPVTLNAVDAGGTWSGPGITSAANGTFDPAVAGNGNHTITYTISGVCGDVDNITINVASQILATINPAGPFCVDAPAINLTAVNPGGTWSGTGITNPNTGTFNPATAGVGTHTITYITSGNCSDTSTINIVVNPLPNVTFSADIVSGCTPVTVTFTDNTTPAATSALWTFGGAGTSNQTGTVTHTFVTPQCYDITLQLTNTQGCTSSATQSNLICVYDYPVTDFVFGPQPVTTLDPTIQFTNLTVGGTTYLWDFDGQGTSTLTHPSFTFDSSGIYNVCLSSVSGSGCFDSTCHPVIISEQFLVYVPNAFTPDGDGKNDMFYPVIAGHDIEVYEFYIFNRWGELIFKSNEVDSRFTGKGWDGTHKGQKCKEDVYVWKIRCKDDTFKEKKFYYGHVTLLR